MAVVPDDEVFMNLRMEVLEDLREEIVAKLEPYKLYSYLRQKRVMDADDCEMIDAKTTRRQRAEKFLDILNTKGPEGFDHFCEGIRKRCTGQLDLLRMILTEFDRRRSDLEPKHLHQSLCDPTSPGGPKLNDVLPIAVSIPQPETNVHVVDNLPAPGDNVPGVPTPPDELGPVDSRQSLPPPYAEEPPPYTA